MTIQGSLDVLTAEAAMGWAYAPDRVGNVVVQAVLSSEIIGDALASEHRSDLAAVGLGEGNCGFTIRFHRQIEPIYLPFVSIKVDGGDIELPRTGQLGFVEFFSALYRDHPSAGRSRSVFGGLWTDRTDAAALLNAKVQIGQIADEPASVVGELIHHGIAIVSETGNDINPTKRSDSALLEQLAAILEEPRMLAVLRSVFEDNLLVLSAEELRGCDTELVQPSAEARHPSPGECLVIVAPFAEAEITVEIVRDSHLLPEFTPAGVSRWASAQPHAALELAVLQQGLISQYTLPPGAAAIIGPGTIYRLRCGDGSETVRLRCVPARSMPLVLAEGGRLLQESIQNGRTDLAPVPSMNPAQRGATGEFAGRALDPERKLLCGGVRFVTHGLAKLRPISTSIGFASPGTALQPPVLNRGSTSGT